ncbi:MAG: two-component regulator propeller domain-containing protein [Saprospiraceae bacterium]
MTSTFFKYCFFFLLTFFSQFLIGQDPAYHQLTDEDGLPSLTIYKIQQSHDGYIWMGTANGVSRFDGREFKHFSDRRMKDSEIMNLQVDAFNRIWFRNLSKQLFCIIEEKIVSFEELTNGKYILGENFAVLDNYIYLFTN